MALHQLPLWVGFLMLLAGSIYTIFDRVDDAILTYAASAANFALASYLRQE